MTPDEVKHLIDVFTPLADRFEYYRQHILNVDTLPENIIRDLMIQYVSGGMIKAMIQVCQNNEKEKQK